MNEIGYDNLVQKTFIEKWRTYEKPLQTESEDFKAGVALLTKIAIEAVEREFSVNSKPNLSIVSDSERLNEVTNKIKMFVKDKAYDFGRACQTGFPFSLLRHPFTEAALKNTLEHHNSILSQFMMLQDSWLSEKELDLNLSSLFQSFQAEEIARTCSELKQTYVSNSDKKSGYYLLWLIKQAIGCSYDIPEKNAFDDTTVGKVLSDFFQALGPIKHATNCVEILFFRESRVDQSLYQEFLDQKSSAICLNLAIKQLLHVPMEKWPNKGFVITNLLEILSSKDQLTLARVLPFSEDPPTSKLGEHLLAALNVSSLTKAIPHFSVLAEMLPHVNYTHFEHIFGCPYIEFNKCFSKKDPIFTKRLPFNVREEVFVHQSLMIGIYDTRWSSNGKGIPAHLLAYDMNSEKLMWGLPLHDVFLKAPSLRTFTKNHADYSLNWMGEYIVLRFIGKNQAYLIHSETGRFSSLELPEPFKNAYDYLHICQQGFAYQMVNQSRRLIGGEIVDSRWNPSFEVNTPSGAFCPFSTHCGFELFLDNELVLFGPKGGQVTLSCMSAQAYDDKLYSIEKDHTLNDKCLLTIRTLKLDDQVVSGVEKRIPHAGRLLNFQ
jgi:hypothetical protein